MTLCAICDATDTQHISVPSKLIDTGAEPFTTHLCNECLTTVMLSFSIMTAAHPGTTFSTADMVDIFQDFRTDYADLKRHVEVDLSPITFHASNN